MSYARTPLQSPELSPMDANRRPELASAGISALALLQGTLGNGFMAELLGLGARAAGAPGVEEGEQGRIGILEGMGALGAAHVAGGVGGSADLASDFVEQSRGDLVGGVDALAGAARAGLGMLAGAASERSPLLGLAAGKALGDAQTGVDVAAGFTKAGLDTAFDLEQMLLDPQATASGLFQAGAHVPLPFNGLRALDQGALALQGKRSWEDALWSGYDPRASLDEDKAFWAGAVDNTLEPYKEAWNDGRYGEAGGRLLFEVLPDLIGAGLGLRGARTLARANRVVDGGKELGGARRLTDAEMEGLVRTSGERLQAEGWTKYTPDELWARTRLQESWDFFEEYRDKLMEQGLSRKQAASESAGTHAYAEYDPTGGRNDRMFFPRHLPEALSEEVVQHEVVHLFSHKDIRGANGGALSEALTQWKTERLLGRPVESYPHLLGVAKELEGLFGTDYLDSLLRDGRPYRLVVDMNKRKNLGPGLGFKMMDRLKEALALDSAP